MHRFKEIEPDQCESADCVAREARSCQRSPETRLLIQGRRGPQPSSGGSGRRRRRARPVAAALADAHGSAGVVRRRARTEGTSNHREAVAHSANGGRPEYRRACDSAPSRRAEEHAPLSAFDTVEEHDVRLARPPPTCLRSTCPLALIRLRAPPYLVAALDRQKLGLCHSKRANPGTANGRSRGVRP